MQKWLYCSLVFFPFGGAFGEGLGKNKGIFLITHDGQKIKKSGNGLEHAIIALNELGNNGYEVVGFNFSHAPVRAYLWTLKRARDEM